MQSNIDLAAKRNRASPPQQTEHAAAIPDALLKVATVVKVTGLSESSIRRRVVTGDFPAPIKQGLRCTRWRAGDVTTWLRGMVRA
jgi:prophage regulatory protein